MRGGRPEKSSRLLDVSGIITELQQQSDWDGDGDRRHSIDYKDLLRYNGNTEKASIQALHHEDTV